MKKILLFVMLLFLPLIKVNALYCTYNDIAYLKKLASNISYSYNYIENNGMVSFSMTLTNFQKDFYILDTTTNQKYYYNQSEVTINGYTSGEIVKYEFYANEGNCSEQLLYSLSIVLPTYNPYYNDQLCSTISNYSLCQKWYNNKLTYEQFKSNVQAYLNSLKPVDNNDETEKENKKNILIEYLLKYYYIPLVLTILGCSIGIYFINKKSNIYE